MAENSAIEWTDHTFNPWMGCMKVSPGCDHCYAETRMDARLHVVQWGAGQPRVRTKDWSDPGRWNRKHAAFFAVHGRRQRVFCASLADLFDNEVPASWRADLLMLIRATPHLDWILLTKRIGNVMRLLREAEDLLRAEDLDGWDWLHDWTSGSPPANVWLGATIVNQDEADRDIPKLLATPARVRFLSMEPLLGPVSLDCFPVYGEDEKPLLHWVIVGGESGPGARPMHPAWARSLRDQCAAAGVPFMFKQWGEWAPHPPTPGFDEGGALRKGLVQYLQGDGREPDGHFRRGDAAVHRIGKKAAGRLLDGRTHDEFPAA
jgi:protein gp37